MSHASVDVAPLWAPFRLSGGGKDGLVRRRGPGIQRYLRRDGRGVHVGVAALPDGRYRFAARGSSADDAEWGIARLRSMVGIDDDLAEFHERFRGDPMIGRAVRAFPGARVRRRPPWEALAWAICEQLIELDRAMEIARLLTFRHGSRDAATGLRDAPSAAEMAALSPAQIAACGLADKRCITMLKAAREVASGRVDVESPVDHEAGWRRLRVINGVGSWTIENLAFFGQGRMDQLPALDLGYLKLVGRLTTGNPKAVADEAEVRGLFEPYGAWKGFAGHMALIGAARGLVTPPARQSPRPPTSLQAA